MSDWVVTPQQPAATGGSDWVVTPPASPAAPAPPPEEPANPVAAFARSLLGIDPRARFSLSNIGNGQPDAANLGPRIHDAAKSAVEGINSTIDSATLGGYGGIQRLAGDPFGAARGIDEYRAAHPTLSAITDAPAYLAEAPARALATGVEKALPQVSNRFAQVARTALASGATSAVAAGAQSAAHGAPLAETGEATLKGGGEGLALGAGLGAGASLIGKLGEAVLNSKGGRARRFIEQRGNGAQVGVASPGIGGVFDDPNGLAGVPSSSGGEGEAAMRGGRQLLDQHEADWSTATSSPPDDYRRTAGDYGREIRQKKADAIGPQPRRNVPAQIAPAEQELAGIESSHDLTKKTYRSLLPGVQEKSRQAPLRDASELVSQMRDAVADLSTSSGSRKKLAEMLSLLEPQADAEGTIKLSETDLNEVRRWLMRETKLGATDVRGEAEAPLRNAAFTARDMVNEGPYRDLNAFYAKGSGENVANREGAGLRKRPPSDRRMDVERIARRRADQKFNADTEDYGKRSAHAADEAQAYVNEFESSKNRARNERLQLGLSEDIPRRRAVDENALKLRLLDRTKDTHTAGGKASFPGTATTPNLDDYLFKHPELHTAADLPKLAQARNRLTFGVTPHGGDLLHVSRMGMLGKIGLLMMNAPPINGRLLYRPALEAATASPEVLKLFPLFTAAHAAEARK